MDQEPGRKFLGALLKSRGDSGGQRWDWEGTVILPANLTLLQLPSHKQESWDQAWRLKGPLFEGSPESQPTGIGAGSKESRTRPLVRTRGRQARVSLLGRGGIKAPGGFSRTQVNTEVILLPRSFAPRLFPPAIKAPAPSRIPRL
jgi:hypothetical protein